MPHVLPRFLPDDWKGGFVLLVMVFVLSSFLDNIAAALIGGTVAASVFKRRVHIGYLAAIVAASNAGGSGSVVGDTTTTMMWIDGVSPCSMFFMPMRRHSGIAAVRLLRRTPATCLCSRSRKTPARDQGGLGAAGIVAWILVAAIGTNIIINTRFAEYSSALPVHRRGGVGGDLLAMPLSKPEWSLLPDAIKGSVFLLSLVFMRVDDAGGKTAGRFLGNRLRFGLRLGGIRQHPADCIGAQARRV